jgi:hypothetical protein
MAETQRENILGKEAAEVPKTLAEITPPSYPHAVEMGYIIESLMQVQKSLGELKAHVEQTNSRINIQEQNSRADFRWTWSGLATATVLLIGALIFGYFKLDDKVAAMSTGLITVETKVDSLLERTPPPPTILPRR